MYMYTEVIKMQQHEQKGCTPTSNHNWVESGGWDRGIKQGVHL